MGQLGRLRDAEWILLAYFAYAAVMGLASGTRDVSRWQLTVLNSSIALLFLFGLTKLSKSNPARDWLPYPLTLLCYREAGWIAPAVKPHGLEHKWIILDRVILDSWHGRAVVEALGEAIPLLLEAAYLSVYVIALLAVGLLYLYGRRERADMFWAAFLLGLMFSYAQFPLWPSDPPRTVFPLTDLPAYLTPLRRLNLFLVGNYGIHTSVFPSAHVSGAIAGALMTRRLLPHRWAGNGLLAIAILIAVATVYGRYHYAVDAIAGAAAGIVAYRVARRLEQARHPKVLPSSNVTVGLY